MLMGVFSYIADITNEEERTLRIGIVNLCFSLGVPIGMAFSGVLLKCVTYHDQHHMIDLIYLACNSRATEENVTKLITCFRLHLRFASSRRQNEATSRLLNLNVIH